MTTNIGKNISKNLSNKYSQKRLDHVKQYATDALKTASKRAIPKKVEATDDLIGNKTTDKITNVSRTAPQNSWKTVECEAENKRFDKEIPKERYILQKIDRKLLMI